jgi:hypothetical protein
VVADYGFDNLTLIAWLAHTQIEADACSAAPSHRSEFDQPSGNHRASNTSKSNSKMNSGRGI